MKRDLTQIAQGLVNHIGTVSEEHDLNGAEMRELCAVVLALHYKASGISLSDTFDELARVWSRANFRVAKGGES